MLEQNECDASYVTTNVTSHNDCKFTFNHLPNNIHVHTVAIDSQHLLWIDPHFSNGIQYLKFLSKYTVTKYFDQFDAAALYMNFNLPSVVSNSVPKSNTQKQRDKNTTTKTEYSTTRLLCENKKTISDDELIQCWDDVIADRKMRNQIVRYVGYNFHHSHLRPGKKVIINSEAQQNDVQYVP